VCTPRILACALPGSRRGTGRCACLGAAPKAAGAVRLKLRNAAAAKQHSPTTANAICRLQIAAPCSQERTGLCAAEQNPAYGAGRLRTCTRQLQASSKPTLCVPLLRTPIIHQNRRETLPHSSRNVLVPPATHTARARTHTHIRTHARCTPTHLHSPLSRGSSLLCAATCGVIRLCAPLLCRQLLRFCTVKHALQTLQLAITRLHVQKPKHPHACLCVRAYRCLLSRSSSWCSTGMHGCECVLRKDSRLRLDLTALINFFRCPRSSQVVMRRCKFDRDCLTHCHEAYALLASCDGTASLLGQVSKAASEARTRHFCSSGCPQRKQKGPGGPFQRAVSIRRCQAIWLPHSC